MKVGSLFSGVGGFELGTSMVFPQADIIWQCEMDKYCQRILHKHWPTAIIYDDVRTIDTNTLPDIDLLLCGFPCQDLSIANNTKETGNINGQKSGLWWEAHRIIKAKRPKYLALENVPAITYRNKGGMAVLQSLAALGYDAWWDCIRASDMGAPHVRERWFLIAIATDTNGQRIEEHTTRTIAMEAQQQPECGGSEDVRPYTTDYWKAPPTQSPLCSVDDGIPNRVARLRAMGNAIVPQCAAFVAHQLQLLIQTGEKTMSTKTDTYFQCLGYIVSSIRWDDTCPNQLKILAYRSNGRNYIDLQTLRSWSQDKVISIAHQLQETT